MRQRQLGRELWRRIEAAQGYAYIADVIVFSTNEEVLAEARTPPCPSAARRSHPRILSRKTHTPMTQHPEVARGETFASLDEFDRRYFPDSVGDPVPKPPPLPIPAPAAPAGEAVPLLTEEERKQLVGWATERTDHWATGNFTGWLAEQVLRYEATLTAALQRLAEHSRREYIAKGNLLVTERERDDARQRLAESERRMIDPRNPDGPLIPAYEALGLVLTALRQRLAECERALRRERDEQQVRALASRSSQTDTPETDNA